MFCNEWQVPVLTVHIASQCSNGTQLTQGSHKGSSVVISSRKYTLCAAPRPSNALEPKMLQLGITLCRAIPSEELLHNAQCTWALGLDLVHMWQRREMQMPHKYNAIRAINAALLPAFLCFYCIALHGERDAFCIWDASRAQGRRRIKCNRGVIRWKRRMQLPFGAWASALMWWCDEQRVGGSI